MAWAWRAPQPVGAGAVFRVVGEVVGSAGQGHGTAGVGQQHPYSHGGGLDLADADLIEGFLDRAMEGFAGEPGEVDGDVLAGEGLLDEGTQADRGRGEDRRSRPWRAGRLPAHTKVFRSGALKELFRGPAGKHFLQDAAVVGVGQAAQRAGEPAVQLRAAGVAAREPAADQLRRRHQHHQRSHHPNRADRHRGAGRQPLPGRDPDQRQADERPRRPPFNTPPVPR
jgi:hypothetical protein